MKCNNEMQQNEVIPFGSYSVYVCVERNKSLNLFLKAYYKAVECRDCIEISCHE